ncbi:O-succinylhomoserine sulfhydrylase [Zhongshania aliphaticivorans]|uniref:O-succinylhomoserine sulfhydrylase n=1 Tax=Zhongshania aliphaticivorans TaxID=1470434 RepID=A0A5S9NER4_9GAMM|nr:O-succinylhomoserine sulfhydrylase [Zhongshania aliphaticivorans]CAA0087938.1 O-succinylhomoserine sulfhydrylase [Zhongshania aliphaticivorans]CAA0115680.1 O-succinylhomoserine sulfhydrylase [Zhongshania aliphaticivorans]CAA0120278.1 O-succinylhomoserine sulfhydrylase [Zhongshania aliphaticivorans]
MTEQEYLAQRQSVLAEAELDTRAVRAGQVRTAEGEHAEPIFMTSSYVFASASEAAARFSGAQAGNVYSRYTNPTVRTFEERIAALEGAEMGVATASGMAAILSTCIALLQTGDHVVCSRSVFGTTTVLLTKYLAKLGISTTFVSPVQLSQWQRAITPNTKLLLLETPSNPLSEIADIRALADIAHQHNCLLVVDNCFCTPALQQPLALGADIVVHSATKYLDGQGRSVGGAVVGRVEQMNEVLSFIRTAGPSMSPFNAWVFLKGLETLRLRMLAHSASALTLATWLQEQTAVVKVHYAGLIDHPQHALAASQQKAFGGVLSFEVGESQEDAWQFIDATRLMSITANLGDAKTTIVHPATTTHGRLTPEQRLEAGITDNLIRVSVGLEDVEDLRKDLQRGLSAV